MAYIDREQVCENCNNKNYCEKEKCPVYKVHTAEVEEVKHGEWIEDGDYQVCSVCGEEHHWDEYRATYCDACGAKMDGRK